MRTFDCSKLPLSVGGIADVTAESPQHAESRGQGFVSISSASMLLATKSTLWLELLPLFLEVLEALAQVSNGPLKRRYEVCFGRVGSPCK